MSPTGKATQINSIVHYLVVQSTQATPAQIQTIANHAAAAPFATDLLEVDTPLWESFWQGDVIAPGYQLPVAELALLRATRLDAHWSEDTSMAQFLADLHQAVQHPRTGMWTLAVAGEPCLVFAAGEQGAGAGGRGLVTVVWYCATTGKLHAGYRTTAPLHFEQAVTQRAPRFTYGLQPAVSREQSWLAQTIEQDLDKEKQGLTARLDAEILRIRLAGLTGKKS